MQNTQIRPLRKTVLATAMMTAIGVSSIPTSVNADIYVWGSTTPDLTGATTASIIALADYTTICADSADAATVIFTMLDSTGAPMDNTSAAKGTNGFQTSTCGTLSYDTALQTGSATIAPFDFFSGTAPALATGIKIEKIPGGSGNLLMGNMLFDWSGNIGIPVSLVWDGEGILSEMDGTPTSFTLNTDGTLDGTETPFTGSGAIPGSDGTYYGVDTGGAYLYLGLGAMPMASTEWNLTAATDCGLDGSQTDYQTGTGCMNHPKPGVEPLITDTTANVNKYNFDDGVPDVDQGIGSVPMWDGPFINNNANFDFSNLKLVSFTDETAPVITLDGTQGNTINLPEGGTYVEDGATCTDALPLPQGALTVTIDNSTVPVPLDTTGSPYTVTYDCNDESSNAAIQVTRTITVVPDDAPIITLGGTSPVTHECRDTYVDAGASCIDPQDGAIILTDPDDIDTLSLDTTLVGSYTVTWSCTDSGIDNNTPDVPITSTQGRIVDVVDTTAPVITINTPVLTGTMSSGTLILETTDLTGYTNPSADATDSCDLSFPITVNTSDTPNWTITAGNQVNSVLTYTATDTDLQTATYELPVEVHRSEPVISLIGGETVVINVGDTYTELGMNIHDEQVATDLSAVTASGSDSNFSYTISGTVDTNTEGNYSITYTAMDSDLNVAAEVVRTVKVGVFASASNFTMLDAAGLSVGGTNDVIFDWPEADAVLADLQNSLIHSSLNSDEVDYSNNTKFNMTIVSAGPQPFFAAIWEAHHVRVFGPGTYSFDSGCTVAEVEATGCPAGSAANSGAAMNITVGDGQLGAHMLFDYNGSYNIDVVNLWDVDGIWADPDGATSEANDMWTQAAIVSDDGLPPSVDEPWKLVSRDVDGNGINGAPMVELPFPNFHANFNAGGLTGDLICNPPVILDTVNNRCVLATTISDDTLEDSTLGAIGLTTLFGMLPLLGLLRRRNRR